MREQNKTKKFNEFSIIIETEKELEVLREISLRNVSLPNFLFPMFKKSESIKILNDLNEILRDK